MQLRQAKAILAGVRPRDLAGKTRRRLAAEQLAELVAVEKKMKELTRELKAMALARGSTLSADPGGHCGASLISSAADSHPLIDTSDQPLPGPAKKTLRRTG